ncbi:hypothetical protein FB451DRAFT_1057155, partial [Mycena latifolia]
VNGVLYKIHLSILLKMSEAMSAILSIPDGKSADDPTREGNKKYPFHLDGITKEEFDDLLNGFVYHSSVNSPPDHKERVYTNLLKLADRFIMPAGRAFAIKSLEDIYLPPSRRLELAAKFSIPDWIAPAVKWILNRKLTDLTPVDLDRIGIGMYSILVQAKEKMDVEVRRTANIAPAMVQDPTWKCADHKRCTSTWKRLWRDEIGWKMLHPTFPLKPDDIAWTVQKFSHPGLNESCRDDMVREIRDNIEFFDERLVPATAATICKFLDI